MTLKAVHLCRQVVPLVVHVGCSTAIFFHLGWIQSFSAKLGWLMKITLQTTAIESVSLAANIFLSTVRMHSARSWTRRQS